MGVFEFSLFLFGLELVLVVFSFCVYGVLISAIFAGDVCPFGADSKLQGQGNRSKGKGLSAVWKVVLENWSCTTEDAELDLTASMEEREPCT